MHAATITIRTAEGCDGDVLQRTAGEFLTDCRFSAKPAPDGRGTELHVSSDKVGKTDLKDALRKCRATIEAGELPTGERRP